MSLYFRSFATLLRLLLLIRLLLSNIFIEGLTIGLDLINDVRIYDKMYFYEMSPFLYSGIYSNLKNRIKYAFGILEKNLVSNDVHVKYFNELKTIVKSHHKKNAIKNKKSFFKTGINFHISTDTRFYTSIKKPFWSINNCKCYGISVLFNIYRTSTTVSKNIKLNNVLRFYPGGGTGKKVLEEATKKCIGAGCSSTRPFISQNTSPLTSSTSPTPPTPPAPPAPAKSPNIAKNPSHNASTLKDSNKPFKSILNDATDNHVPKISPTQATSIATVMSEKSKQFLIETSKIYTSKYEYKFQSQNTEQNKSVNPMSAQLSNSSLTNEKSLINHNNKLYQTTISNDTIVSNVTDDQLLQELKRRSLVKDDPGNTAVNIKLQDNSDYLLGTSKHKVKLSPMGQAYVEKSEIAKKQPQKEEIQTNSEVINHAYMIIIPPEKEDKLFIETGKEKHMLVTLDKNNNYIAIGYLTSKRGEFLLSNKQVKQFQQEKESICSDKANKDQYLLPFENSKKIEEKDMRRVKWDQEYMKNIPQNTRDDLDVLCDRLQNKPVESFDTFGITKQAALDMCIEYDKIAQTSGVKHPLTAHQTKQNEENKQSNKEKHKNKPNKQHDQT